MTRTQLLLALLLAVVLGLGMAFLASPGRFYSTAERFRDTAAALKKMYRERDGNGTPREQVLAR